MYSWPRVAQRTQRIYDQVAERPDGGLAASLARHYRCGPVFGKLACCVVAAVWLYWQAVEWLWPRGDVDAAPDLCPHFQPAGSLSASRQGSGAENDRGGQGALFWQQEQQWQQPAAQAAAPARRMSARRRPASATRNC